MMNNFAKVGLRAVRPIMLHNLQHQPISYAKKAFASGNFYSAIAILASVQIGTILFGTYAVDKKLTMTISDFTENGFVKDNQSFQIVGIIKPGTIEISRGTLDIRFILTDFEREVNIFYRGQTKFEFKEGETLVLTGYLPDRNDKTKMIGTEYLTKHSMDGNLWQDKIGVERKNFGVNNKVSVMN